MDELTTTAGVVALAGTVVALIAVAFATVLAFKLRSLTRSQKVVLGEAGQRDLVGHATELQEAVKHLQELIEDIGAHSQKAIDGLSSKVDSAYSHCGLVRYDAYNEMSGMQSSSIALLDRNRNGVVITSIVHRDSARTYVKSIIAGDAPIELSPEEREAVDTALSSEMEKSHVAP